jgi:hypothetical protein
VTGASAATDGGWRQIARAAQWELRRWSYLDLGGGPEDTVFIAGSGRSGTTWVEEVVDRHHDHRVMFEPFWPQRVSAVAAMTEGLYLRNDNSDTRYVQPVQRVLEGRLRNGWVDHLNRVRLARRRLVKEIRANCWLGWAARRWPQMPMVFVVRHPLAVATSGLGMGWSDGLDRMLAQPMLIADHCPEHVDYLNSLTDPLERAVARWCIENLVPFRMLGSNRATLVLYEDLVAEPTREAERLLEAFGQRPDNALAAALRRPSHLSAGGSAATVGAGPVTAWRERLDPTQRRQAVAVVRRLGFGDVYGEDPWPNSPAAHQWWASAE